MIDGYSLFVILRALFSACNILDLSEIQFLFCHYFGETLHAGYSTQQTTHTTHTHTHQHMHTEHRLSFLRRIHVGTKKRDQSEYTRRCKWDAPCYDRRYSASCYNMIISYGTKEPGRIIAGETDSLLCTGPLAPDRQALPPNNHGIDQ